MESDFSPGLMQDSIEALPHDALWVMSKFRKELCVMGYEFLTDHDYEFTDYTSQIRHYKLK